MKAAPTATIRRTINPDEAVVHDLLALAGVEMDDGVHNRVEPAKAGLFVLHKAWDGVPQSLARPYSPMTVWLCSRMNCGTYQGPRPPLCVTPEPFQPQKVWMPGQAPVVAPLARLA